MLVIIVRVVILVVFFRAKMRKQRLEITENNRKGKYWNDIDADLSANQPPYAEIQTEAPPQVPSHSEELMEYLNQNSTLTKYSEVELEQAESKHIYPPCNAT